jgi:hypothetical protein
MNNEDRILLVEVHLITSQFFISQTVYRLKKYS